MAKKHEAAVAHLRACDPILRAVIERAGPVALRSERNRFWMIVCSIISQQLSTSSARTIRARVDELLPERSAEALSRVKLPKLRAAGVSPQKAGYLADLCQAIREGRIDLDRIGRRADEAVIEELTQVKGIGRWTAQMFLIFSLGRPDVFPSGDLGVRAAIRDLYGMTELPDEAAAHAIATPWRPYASVASWYCWRSLEFKKEK